MPSFIKDFEPKFFYHLYSHKIFFWVFIAFFAMQVMFWKHTESIKPDFDIVPPAPNKYLVSAASLGDEEFLFRVFATRLQNSGDVFAGFIALKNYDYKRIYQWLTMLDTLNSESDFTPSLATYYYAHTQNKPDTKYIVNYLDEHSSKDIDKNWWWLFQAIYIARNNMGDLDRALELAYKLSENEAEDAPFWTKQMPAFIHEQKGEGCLAFKVITELLKESDSGTRHINAENIDFMRTFITQRLESLKHNQFDPRKCQNL